MGKVEVIVKFGRLKNFQKISFMKNTVSGCRKCDKKHYKHCTEYKILAIEMQNFQHNLTYSHAFNNKKAGDANEHVTYETQKL